MSTEIGGCKHCGTATISGYGELHLCVVCLRKREEEPADTDGMTVAEFIRHLQDHFRDPDRDVITSFSVTGRNYSEEHGRHICTTKTEGPKQSD